MMLRSVCQAYKLKLVNTFMDAPTWASIDFIAVSRSHFEAVPGCWVDRSIDIAQGGRDDHWVLAVRLDLTEGKDLVGNPSSGDLPLVLPFENDSESCMWNPVVIRTRLLKCGDVGLSLQLCSASNKRFFPRKCGRRGFLSPVSRKCSKSGRSDELVRTCMSSGTELWEAWRFTPGLAVMGVVRDAWSR